MEQILKLHFQSYPTYHPSSPMALRLGFNMFSGFFLALIAVRFSLSFALIASQDINPPYPKAISVSEEIFCFIVLYSRFGNH